jgi:predicted pyridoxine 5'-phosphate oxidase superfamily flavin-nucleotide-binding protein
MNWQDIFKEGKEIVLATSSKNGEPIANIVVSLGFINKKLLVADCQMNTTIRNILSNPQICAVSGAFRIRGKCEVYDKGEYFDISAKRSKGYKVKNAILIEVLEVFNLDKQSRLI